MNNKGQSLVLFVILIPIFILVFAFIFDNALMIIENNKIENIAKSAVKYLVKDNKSIDTVTKFIIKNDKNIEIISIEKDKVHIKKYINTTFSNIVSKQKYKLEVIYQGYIENNNFKIEKKG